ncbi:MAG TPA: M20/M25/M40 family metallo-hydrolase [Sphingobacteriaceae bacterium]
MQATTISTDQASKWLEELRKFGAIKNNVFEAKEIADNAAYLNRLLEKEGFKVELWNTPSGKPYVYGELLFDESLPTVLFYSHFDGVPVDQSQWDTDPYSPLFKNNSDKFGNTAEALAHPASYRLYGRSVADSKNAIISLLAAVSSLHAEGIKAGMNIKLLLDGEEELESPHFKTTVLAHQKQLEADLVISASGETHQSGLPTIAFGVRGILMLDMILHTARSDMHSGHFGNFTPNAPFKLAKLLSEVKDENGKVLIPGFYSKVKPLNDNERNAIHAVPAIEQQIREQFAIRHQEATGTLQEMINQPTFNIRGFQAGYVGEKASNIIPAKAEASIDIRLVDGMNPDETYDAILDFIKTKGFYVTENKPTVEELRHFGPVLQIKRKGSFEALRTDMNSGLPAKVLSVVTQTTAEDWVVEPTEGGSLNFSVFRELNIPLITLPVSNFDCNQHTHNENLRVDFFLRGINIYRQLLKLTD